MPNSNKDSIQDFTQEIVSQDAEIKKTEGFILGSLNILLNERNKNEKCNLKLKYVEIKKLTECVINIFYKNSNLTERRMFLNFHQVFKNKIVSKKYINKFYRSLFEKNVYDDTFINRWIDGLGIFYKDNLKPEFKVSIKINENYRNKLLRLLSQVWKQSPELSFTQLLVDLIGLEKHSHGMYKIYDAELLDNLEKNLKEYKIKN